MIWQEAAITIAPFALAIVTSASLAFYILVWYRHVWGAWAKVTFDAQSEG